MEYLVLGLSFLSGIILLALSVWILIYFFKNKKVSPLSILGGLGVLIIWAITFLTTFQTLSATFINFHIILKIIVVTLIYGIELLLLDWIFIKVICKGNRDYIKNAAGIGLFQGILFPILMGAFLITNGINVSMGAFQGAIIGIDESIGRFITNNGSAINVYPFSDTLLDFVSFPVLVVGICLCLISISVSCYSFTDRGNKLTLIPSLIISMLMVAGIITFIFISFNLTGVIYKIVTYGIIPLTYVALGLINLILQFKIYNKQ
ncbi:MAG: hypothetical protein IKZ25_02295 [Clostridia bacterium]|nr:hypothetical protein [Clostridia bacterium]